MPSHPKLSLLDLLPVIQGESVASALAASLKLVQEAEQLGFDGFWFGEHHLGPGRVGAAPAVLVALAASRTKAIRLGSAVCILSNYSPLALVEQFATIAELYPGRIVLGLGRGSGTVVGERGADIAKVQRRLRGFAHSAAVPVVPAGDFQRLQGSLLTVATDADAIEDGRLIELLSYLHKEVADLDGVVLRASPGLGAPLTPWLFGNSAGRSAVAAARHGLPFVANAHMTAEAQQSVRVYRENFVPSSFLSAPHVAISANVFIGRDRQESERIAASYPHWVAGLIARHVPEPLRPPDPAFEPKLDAAGRDEFDTALGLRIIGEPSEVSDRLLALAAEAGADEIIVNTIIHDHAARFRSIELLARTLIP